MGRGFSQMTQMGYNKILKISVHLRPNYGF